MCPSPKTAELAAKRCLAHMRRTQPNAPYGAEESPMAIFIRQWLRGFVAILPRSHLQASWLGGKVAAVAKLSPSHQKCSDGSQYESIRESHIF